MQRVEQLGDIRALREEWLALFRRCPRATPFQHPDWCMHWWEVFQPGEPALYVLRRGRTLTGVAPLYRGEGGLLPLGAGISDYLDFLVDPACESEGAAALLDACGACDLFEVPEWSPLLRHRSCETCCSCPVAALPVRPAPKLRKNLRHSRYQLAQRGGLRFDTETGGNHREYLHALFRLHSARWNSLGETGVLADERLRRFHLLAAAAFARDGLLRLHGLRVAGQLVAVWYWFARHGRAYCYLSGFHPALARYSPGALLTQYALEHAAAEGDRECDFLRGNEPYKYRWGARERMNYRLPAPSR